MTALPPRVVLVTRETDYEQLLARHATPAAVRFHLEMRGQSLEAVEAQHHTLQDVLRGLRNAVPRAWRQAVVRRSELDRFLFAPGDIVTAVGQDGLVANVAKYIDGQPVLGVNPDPATIDGVLARIAPAAAADMLRRVAAGEAKIEARTMVEARLDSGQRLLALNEIFVGHRSHQSARYEIGDEQDREFQSSSGVIITSGTGATGWARSIMLATGRNMDLDPCAPVAAYFVREAWPSHGSGTARVSGRLTQTVSLHMISRMEGGTVFADGIETDFLPFTWGSRLQVRPARGTLSLVVG